MARKAAPRHPDPDAPDDHDDHDGKGQDRDRFPNMTAQKDMDREESVRRAEELGATRKQATQHADDEVGGH
ncbi:MAG: hypothetical protein ACYC2H_12865 [Thermoplasmatota archaeon]